MTYNELCDAILTAQEEMLKYKIEANSVTLNGRKYGMLVKNCPPNMTPTIFGMAVKAEYTMPDDYDFLVQYEPPQPQTNYDRIVSKTPYELADWIADVLNHCDNKAPGAECRDSCPLYKCCNDQPYDNIEDWLKSPAEEKHD